MSQRPTAVVFLARDRQVVGEFAVVDFLYQGSSPPRQPMSRATSNDQVTLPVHPWQRARPCSAAFPGPYHSNEAASIWRARRHRLSSNAVQRPNLPYSWFRQPERVHQRKHFVRYWRPYNLYALECTTTKSTIISPSPFAANYHERSATRARLVQQGNQHAIMWSSVLSPWPQDKIEVRHVLWLTDCPLHKVDSFCS